jgi:glutathione S-transferase
MPDIVLHHYPLSPFSEKVRLALGLKRLDYHSVTIPVWMPKPELMPLTGGYRRTPVMQVGADVFCDTLLILREIERMHPTPTLYPGGTEGVATALGWWAEKFTFVPAVGLVISLIGEHFPPELIEERKPFFGFSIDKGSMQAKQPHFLQRLHAHLTWLGQMLNDGRDFLLGPQPSAADLAAYHPIWFARKNGGPEVDRLLPMAPLAPWYDRVGAIGHGSPHDLPSSEALAIAAKATPADPSQATAASDLPSCRLGDRVSVTPDDTGRDPVLGTLVASSAQEIVLRRTDTQVGEINVHFPRAGFDVAPA